MKTEYLRFQVYNQTGVAFGGLAGDYIDMQCKLLNLTTSSGVLAEQTLASPEVFSIATATLANNAVLNSTSFDASNGGVQAIYQGEVTWQVGITNTATGTVSLLVQSSPDNTTWPSVGVGQVISTITFSAAGSENAQGEF